MILHLYYIETMKNTTKSSKKMRLAAIIAVIIMTLGIFFSCEPQLRDSYSSMEAISFIAAGMADTTSHTVPVVDEYNGINYMNVITIDGTPYYPGMSNADGIRYYRADKYSE